MTVETRPILDGRCTIHVGDCIEAMRRMPSGSVDCVVTSPPYWGLRDYGVEGQIGLERTLAEALDVTEHEADRLINARLNCGYAERLHARRIKRIAYAGKEPFVSEWAR